MKVLLCSPFSQGLGVAQSGIAVWAQNIVSYHNTILDDVKIDVVAYDRKTYVSSKMGLLKRAVLGLLEYYSAIKETKLRLNETQYDVLHLCTSASISLLKDVWVLRIARKRKTKTVIHFHFGRIPEVVLKKKWEWFLLRYVIKMSDVALTMDEFSYSSLIDQGFTNAHYLPNPLSLSILSQIKSESVQVNRVSSKVLFVGHVIPSKGVYDLVDACREIEGIELHVVGKVLPEVKEEMERRAKQGDWLRFEGELCRESVIREMLSSEIFVLPSYTEGFPNVILESMACGCAVVATSVGAIPEMLNIKDGNACGICVTPRDVLGLRMSIETLLKDKKLSRNLGALAAERVNEMYMVPKVWESLKTQWKS